MLKTYLKQTAKLQAAQRDGGALVMDERGEVQYEPETTVACRCQPLIKEVLTADQQKVMTSMVYYLAEPVGIGDLLDGKRVESVAQWVTLGGTVLGWKALC